jgi:hypothetical protein
MKNVFSCIRSPQAKGIRRNIRGRFAWFVGIVGTDDVVHVAVVAIIDGYGVTLVVREQNIEVGVGLGTVGFRDLSGVDTYVKRFVWQWAACTGRWVWGRAS